jgi:hypothetical protein
MTCSRCGAELHNAYANCGTDEKPLCILCYFERMTEEREKRKEAEGQMKMEVDA